jgi:uncharacterized protein
MPRKIIRVGLILSVMLCGMAASAQAQQQQTLTPEKRELIKEFLDVTGSRKNSQAIMEAMLAQVEKNSLETISQSIGQRKGLNAKELEALEQEMKTASTRIIKRYRELFAERIDFPQIIADISYSLYDKYFTESDLKDMIAFYKSPAGHKSIEVMPTLFADSMAEASLVLKPKIEQISKEIMEEELKRVETTPRAASGQTGQRGQRSRRRRP